MKLHSLTLLLSAAALATGASAQVDRDQSARVNYQHLRAASLNDIQTWSAQGYRIGNFELFNNSPTTLNVSLVRNTGVYQATWSYHYGQTRSQVVSLINNQNLRIVDLERYEVNGEERLAVLMFENTGQQYKNWFWHSSLQQGSVYSTVAGVGKRIIDLEPYYENGMWRYHSVSIANSGGDYKDWWVYTDTDPSFVQGHIAQHGSRVYDYERQSIIPSSAACVLVRDDVRSITLWNQYYGASFDADDEYGGRVVDLENASISSYAITLIDNKNPFLKVGFGSWGTQGLTVHDGQGDAFVGTQVTYTAQNLRPWAPSAIHYGLLPMSLSLAPWGAPNCTLRVDPIASTFLWSGANGVATDYLSIPNDSALNGLKLQTQMMASDPGANALGLQTSNLLTTTIRHW